MSTITILTLTERRVEEEARENGYEPCRTFITNVYLSGKFSVEFMMKLSGHKKYDTFKKYVRLSLDEYADDIAKNADSGLF